MAQNINVKTQKDKDEVEKTTGFGRVLLDWDYPEYVKPQRGFLWYLVIGVVSIGLILWATLVEQNYIFVGIILIIVIIIFITSRRKPKTMNIKIAEDGVQIGDRFYFYDQIKNFWIAYEPPVIKTLYLNTKSLTKPLFSVPLEKTNPLKLRDILLEYLEENLDEDGETSTDAWNRVLKL